MRIKGLLKDRQLLIRQLVSETGIPAEYEGSPSFRYRIGDYTVLRDGSLTVDDNKSNDALLHRLAELGLIENSSEADRKITFSADGFTGQTMTNLVNALAARGSMINKALGTPCAVYMSEELVQNLKEDRPATLQEFKEVLRRSGGEKAMQGIQLSSGLLVFTGFPTSEASRVLAKLIVDAAVSKRWMKANTPAATNEKYSFRVWLNSLGMIGPEYSEVRSELLKNFTGDAAYRTEEQQKSFYEMLRKKRSKPEHFILL